MKSVIKKNNNDTIFKIILIGQSGTGKSCLMNRYVKNQFSSLYQTTIGTQFQIKTIKVNEHQKIKLHLWDTAGQESFRSIIKTFFRNSSAVLFIYNITQKRTFQQLVQWKQLTYESVPESCLFILVGTHLDLQQNRQVSRKDAEEWMKKYNMDFFFETSAKTNLNVDLIFQEIGKRLFCNFIQKNKNKQIEKEQEVMKLHESSGSSDTKKMCC